jgi:hypothetical protein
MASTAYYSDSFNFFYYLYSSTFMIILQWDILAKKINTKHFCSMHKCNTEWQLVTWSDLFSLKICNKLNNLPLLEKEHECWQQNVVVHGLPSGIRLHHLWVQEPCHLAMTFSVVSQYAGEKSFGSEIKLLTFNIYKHLQLYTKQIHIIRVNPVKWVGV